MTRSRIRKEGDAAVVAIPQEILDRAGMTDRSLVEITWDAASGTIRMKLAQPRYVLAELAAEHVQGPFTDDDIAWFNDPPVGREMI